MNQFQRAINAVTGKNVGEPTQASEQSPDEVKLVAFVRQKVDDARLSASRVAHEGVWMTNIAYLLGYDGVYYDSSARQYKPVNGKSVKKNRIHVNKILPTIQNRLARLCKNEPKYDVRPESNDQDDKDAARLGLEVLGQVWDKQKINEKRIPLLMWVQQCGHSYFHVSWDEELGRPMKDPLTGEFIAYEGDVRVDIASAFEVFPDPLAKTMDEVSYLTRAKVRKLDYFSRYPRGHLVKEEAAWLLSTQYELKINSINKSSSGADNSQTQMKNAAIELTYYEKPSKQFPKGRMVVTANGILLEDKELPVGEIPYVKFDDIVIGGKFASESTITHLRPLQDYKSELWRKRRDWVAKLLAGKYMAAKGSGLMAEALNNESGEVVEYDPLPNAAPPSAMQVPNIPSYVYQEDDRVDSEMYDISGINEISRGTIPSAGLPAAGMQILQEADDTRIGIVTEQHEHSYAKLGQLILKYIGQNYKMPRMLKAAGEGLGWSVRSFTGADLRENYDVIVVRGSTIPGSKALKRQEILNFYDRGLLGDPADPKVREKMIDMLEYGDIAEIYEDHAIDSAQIKEHLEMIEAGQEPPKEELDNHILHIEVKNRYRKTDKFKGLDAEKRAILMADIEWHIQAFINLTNPEVQQQQEMAEEQLKASEALTPDHIEEEQGLQELAGEAPIQPEPEPPTPPPAA